MDQLGCLAPRRVIIYKDDTNKPEDKEDKERRSTLQKASEAHLVVAALITTVTFAACIIMPRGFVGKEGSHPSFALLRKKCCFQSIRSYGYHIHGIVKFCCLYPSIEAISFEQEFKQRASQSSSLFGFLVHFGGHGNNGAGISHGHICYISAFL